MKYIASIEKWEVFEVTCHGYEKGNPFVDYTIYGTFKGKNETHTIAGFYDGQGNYKVRFMPSYEGTYEFTIEGSFSNQTYEGNFIVTPPTNLNNHGPVRVSNTYHFTYEDGTPYYSIGTTCYVWHLQSEELQQKTIETLKCNAFNKIRFCIFPKHYDYNLKEPIAYPYEGKPMDSSVLTKENFHMFQGECEGNEWNYERFNVAYFQHIDSCIAKLQELGIEADLIVMHPYDRWGFSTMNSKQDDLYWNYIIARYAAYRNVWWSLANEYDLMPQKTIKDWERYAKILCEKDIYGHLRSIHNCANLYDYSRPWITHCSIQRTDIYKTAELVEEWRIRYRKPVVLDEIAYEGNIQYGWGNISGQELVRRFWEATCRGGYAGHGETYLHPKEILWWSHGGELHGDSPVRFNFLLKIIKETDNLGGGLTPLHQSWDEICATAGSLTVAGQAIKPFYLYYYGFQRPSFRDYYFDENTQFDVDVIDTWDMKIHPMGRVKGKFRVELPGREYIAVRIRKVERNGVIGQLE